MSTPDQQRTLFRMRAAVEEMIAAAEPAGARVGFAVDATRVARGAGRLPLPGGPATGRPAGRGRTDPAVRR